MRAATMHWWKPGNRGVHCGAHVGGGPAAHEVREEMQALFGGGGFGVRRPLRFLAWKLGLSEAQITELATILDELKTERAQASVDDRRALTAFAEAVGAEAFDESKARAGASSRAKSAETLQAEVVRALTRMHALLNQEQRAKLAYMIRTGALVL